MIFLQDCCSIILHSNIDLVAMIKGFCRCHWGLKFTETKIKRLFQLAWANQVTPLEVESFPSLMDKGSQRESKHEKHLIYCVGSLKMGVVGEDEYDKEFG